MTTTTKQKAAKVRAAYGALIDAVDDLLAQIERTSGTFECDRPEIRTIQEIVCAHYMVPISAMASPIRTHAFVRPRHVAMWLCRARTNYSLVEIGRCFARDHGAVSAAVESIANLHATDKRFANELDQLKSSVGFKLGRAAA